MVSIIDEYLNSLNSQSIDEHKILLLHVKVILDLDKIHRTQ